MQILYQWLDKVSFRQKIKKLKKLNDIWKALAQVIFSKQRNQNMYKYVKRTFSKEECRIVVEYQPCGVIVMYKINKTQMLDWVSVNMKGPRLESRANDSSLVL